MKNEIDLILTKLKIVSEEQEQDMYLCDKYHIKLLYDYITNLQKELEIKNKGFKSTIEELCETSEKLEQLQEENKILKEKTLLIQGGRFNCKTYIVNLEKENEFLKSKCEKIENNCIKSIESINKKLKDNRELLFKIKDGKILYLNDYQVLRLKAIRMKCKEILRLIRGE